MSHKGFEFGFVGRIEGIDALLDAGFEIREIWKMSSIEAFLLDEFPQSFDQIQVGRVGWQKQQCNTQFFSVGYAIGTILVSCVIENQGDRSRQCERRYFR